MKYIHLLIFLISLPCLAQKQALDSVQSAIRNLNEDTLKVDALLKAGYSFYNSYPEETLEFGKEAYDLSTKLDYEEGKIVGKKVQGIAYWIMSDFRKSIDAYQEGLTLAQQANDTLQISTFFVNLGVVYSDVGELYQALEAYLEGLRLSELLNNKRNIGLCYQNIGTIYSMLKQYDQALTFNSNAMVIFEEIDYATGMGVLQNNNGEILIDLEDYDSALTCFTNARAIFESENHTRGISVTTNNLGNTYTLLSRYGIAYSELHTAIELKLEINDQIGLITAYKYMGRLQLETGDYDEADTYMNMGLSLAKEIEAKEEEIELYRDLSRLYEAKRRPNEALIYHKLYHTYSDSLLNIEKNKRLLELQALYDTERNEKENLQLKQEQALNQQIMSRQQAQTEFYLILLVLSICIITLFAYGFYQKNSTNKKLRLLNESIQSQKNEIEAQSTKLNLAYEEIRDLNDDLEQKVKERTKQIIEYSFKNSHEVRAPLSRILGLIDLYKRESSNIDLDYVVQNLEQSAIELDAIVHEINHLLALEESPKKS